jgi:Fibronectin type III domain
MVSTTGEQTITNNSNGTVEVIVALRGFYASASAPAPPDSPAATVSGQTATVSWTTPEGDGGSPITGFTVAAAPDGVSVTVAGTATQATLTGLANAAGDTFSVTATNAAGTSDAAVYSPPNVISGTVVAPSGQPVSGATVDILPSDVPASAPATWSPSVIGTATTDANGIWTFTVPPYSALPADSQAAANNDGGYLNVDAVAAAYATDAAGDTYNVTGNAERFAFVGTSSQPSGPVAAANPGGGVPAMVVTPDQTDLGAQDTDAAEAATTGSQNSPTLTDANNDVVGDPDNAYAAAPADSYGYQNIAGSNSDGYDPTSRTTERISAQRPTPEPCRPAPPPRN